MASRSGFPPNLSLPFLRHLSINGRPGLETPCLKRIGKQWSMCNRLNGMTKTKTIRPKNRTSISRSNNRHRAGQGNLVAGKSKGTGTFIIDNPAGTAYRPCRSRTINVPVPFDFLELSIQRWCALKHARLFKVVYWAIVVTVATMILFRLFSLPSIPAHEGDGLFEDRSQRIGPFANPGYSISMVDFDLADEQNIEYQISNLPNIGRNCNIYFAIFQPRGARKREPRWGGEATIVITMFDTKKKVVAKIDSHLSNLTIMEVSNRNAFFLYQRENGVFLPDPAEKYTSRVSYDPDADLAAVVDSFICRVVPPSEKKTGIKGFGRSKTGKSKGTGTFVIDNPAGTAYRPCRSRTINMPVPFDFLVGVCPG